VAIFPSVLMRSDCWRLWKTSRRLKQSQVSARQGENHRESDVYTQSMSILRVFSTLNRADQGFFDKLLGAPVFDGAGQNLCMETQSVFYTMTSRATAPWVHKNHGNNKL